MHYGSSEEEASEEEAGAQDRGGEEADGEEDRYRTAEDSYEEKVAGEARGRWLPRLPLSPGSARSLPGRVPPGVFIILHISRPPIESGPSSSTRPRRLAAISPPLPRRQRR